MPPSDFPAVPSLRRHSIALPSHITLDQTPKKAPSKVQWGSMKEMSSAAGAAGVAVASAEDARDVRAAPLPASSAPMPAGDAQAANERAGERAREREDMQASFASTKVLVLLVQKYKYLLQKRYKCLLCRRHKDERERATTYTSL